jgi:hypothetical protein
MCEGFFTAAVSQKVWAFYSISACPPVDVAIAAAADDCGEGGVGVQTPDAVRVHRERLHTPLLA